MLAVNDLQTQLSDAVMRFAARLGALYDDAARAAARQRRAHAPRHATENSVPWPAWWLEPPSNTNASVLAETFMPWSPLLLRHLGAGFSLTILHIGLLIDSSRNPSTAALPRWTKLKHRPRPSSC